MKELMTLWRDLHDLTTLRRNLSESQLSPGVRVPLSVAVDAALEEIHDQLGRRNEPTSEEEQ